MMNNILHAAGNPLELFSNYLFYGWVFVIMHFLVSCSVFNTYRKIRLEKRALVDWLPAGKDEETTSPSGAGFSRTTETLNQFIQETKVMGKRGMLVPVTDYSDRLDSVAEGLIIEFQERVFMFLLVGVLGTLYGMFEFAIAVPDILKNSGETAMGALGYSLVAAVSKAFPVAFIGLLLTMTGNALGHYLDGKFREAMADAIERAAAARSIFVTTTAEAITTALGPLTTLDRIVGNALEPLKKISATVAESLGPLLKDERKWLRDDVDMIAGALKPMTLKLPEMADVFKELLAASKTINEGVVQSNTLLQQIPETFANLPALQQQQQKAIVAFGKSVERLDEQMVSAATSLGFAAQSITVIADEAPSRLQAMMAATRDEMNASLREMVAKTATDIMLAQREGLNSIRDEGRNLGRTLSAAAKAVQEQTGEMRSLVRSGTDELVSILRNNGIELTTSMSAMRDAEIGAWKETMTDVASGLLGGQVEMLSALTEGVNETIESLAKAGQEMETASTKARDLLGAALEVQMELFAERLDTVLSGVEESIRSRFADQLEQSLSAVLKMTSQVDSTMVSLQKVSKELPAVGQSLREMGTEELKCLRQDTYKEWKGAIDEDLRTPLIHALLEVRQGTSCIASTLQEASNTARDAMGTWRDYMSSSLKEITAECTKTFGRAIDTASTALGTQIGDLHARFVETVPRLIELGSHIDNSIQAASSVGSTLDRIRPNFESLAMQLEEAGRKLAGTVEKIDWTKETELVEPIQRAIGGLCVEQAKTNDALRQIVAILSGPGRTSRWLGKQWEESSSRAALPWLKKQAERSPTLSLTRRVLAFLKNPLKQGGRP